VLKQASLTLSQGRLLTSKIKHSQVPRSELRQVSFLATTQQNAAKKPQLVDSSVVELATFGVKAKTLKLLPLTKSSVFYK